MNTDELTGLVERARAGDGPGSVPPADLLAVARAGALRRRAAVVVGLVAGVALAGGTAAVVSDHRSPAPATPPTGATRLVGANGVMLSVPADWATEVQQGSYCAPTSPREVMFFLPFHGGVGSCTVPIGASWPAEDSLTVSTQGPVDAPDTEPAGTVGGMQYYLTDAHQTGPGVARTLRVPDAGVAFTVGAATTEAADALLATVRPVPAGMTTVAVTTQHPDDFSSIDPRDDVPVLDVDPQTPLVAKVVEVHDSDEQPGDLPGYLLRTDPPIGTPVPSGTTVTLEFSAGDLSGYVSDQALADAGWSLADPHQFQPRLSRYDAFDIVPHKYPDGGGGGLYGIYLRELDGRLVWVVAIHQPTEQLLRLTAVAVDDGSIVADHVFPMVDG